MASKLRFQLPAVISAETYIFYKWFIWSTGDAHNWEEINCPQLRNVIMRLSCLFEIEIIECNRDLETVPLWRRSFDTRGKQCVLHYRITLHRHSWRYVKLTSIRLNKRHTRTVLCLHAVRITNSTIQVFSVILLRFTIQQANRFLYVAVQQLYISIINL